MHPRVVVKVAAVVVGVRRRLKHSSDLFEPLSFHSSQWFQAGYGEDDFGGFPTDDRFNPY